MLLESLFIYIIVFIKYAEKDLKVRMIGLLVAVLCVFGLILFISLEIDGKEARWIVVGSLSAMSLISMFVSPLFVINSVIWTRSVEFMPFYLSLSTFLMSTSFFTYGMLNDDPFVYVPNRIGTILGITQLALYFYYKDRSNKDNLEEPLIVSYKLTRLVLLKMRYHFLSFIILCRGES